MRGELNDGCGVLAPYGTGAFACRAGTAHGVDPATNLPPAGEAPDFNTGSPTVLPDGGVLFGAYTQYNGFRGHLMKFDVAGRFAGSFDFGEGITAPVYPHDHTYSLVTKDNYYLTNGPYCYLYDKFGLAYNSMPPWYLEGAPTWTMSVLGAANDKLSSFWTSYLDTPAKPLAQREYDGVGFFAHLAETGTDPWRVIDPIGAALARAPATAAGWKAAAVTAEFRQSWGSGFVQGRYPGKAWTSTGTNLPGYTPALPNAQLGNGASVTIKSPPFAAAVRRIDIDATVVLVHPGAAGTGRISLGNGVDATLDSAGPFCTIAQCACPAGSPGAGTNFTHLTSGQEYVGLSGADQRGTVTLAGQSLPDFCRQPPTSCLVGRWTGVNFDVHLGPLSETGGAGVTLHIDPTGHVTVAFNGMRPVVFHTSAVDGSFVYAGSVTGTIKLPVGGATSGNWGYARPADVSSLTATVHISSPITVDDGPIDVASLAGAGGGAGAAVSAHPLVTGGWRCSGNTLVTSPPPSSRISGSWTLTRTGPG